MSEILALFLDFVAEFSQKKRLSYAKSAFDNNKVTHISLVFKKLINNFKGFLKQLVSADHKIIELKIDFDIFIKIDRKTIFVSS